MHVGDNIRLARVSKGLTQEDLGAMVNRSRNLISRIENSGKVNFYTLRDICEALGVTVEDMENVTRETLDPAVVYARKNEILEEEIQALKAERETLLGIIASQKQVIDVLQKRK